MPPSEARSRRCFVRSASNQRRSAPPPNFFPTIGPTCRAALFLTCGAIEFLTKPFRDQELLDAVQVGLDRDCARRQREQALARLASAYERLTAREKEVLPFVTGADEQADRRQARRLRDHGQSASSQRHAENGSEVAPCLCEDGRASRYWAAEELTDQPPGFCTHTHDVAIQSASAPNKKHDISAPCGAKHGYAGHGRSWPLAREPRRGMP